MKILLPFLTLFLASCGVHHHRYDANQDVYYQDDYYAYDNYDPYYGYGSSEYSYAGDGVYYNNYNYYPDRWGVTYSNVYYTPFRYPRVGFYYSSVNTCSYSYWSSWCYPGYGSYYSSGFWPTFGFAVGYSSFYYDNYWWYNHWRNRNYYYDNYHYKPTQRGYYSARNEALRLNNSRYNSRYKDNYRSNTSRYNKPRPVNRDRSSSNRPVNRAPVRKSPVYRSSKPVQRQQSAVNTYKPRSSSQANTSGRSARTEVISRSNNTNSLQQRISENHATTQQRYQKPLPRSNQRINQQEQLRVKPVASQSPVYHTNRLVKPKDYERSSNQNTRPTVSPVYNRSNNRPVTQSNPTISQRTNSVRAATQVKPATTSKVESKSSRSKSKSKNTSDRSTSKNKRVSRTRGNQ